MQMSKGGWGRGELERKMKERKKRRKRKEILKLNFK